ncbi:MAG TPA: RIP metalloprotease RseP [Candidatus Binataceae bacterium]|nr:RIP metalloprotease RseP [Candidatus Binataceae bacterium]
MLTSILSAAVILAVLIIVHETGHFAMAKRLGVRVVRFSIGYPPKVWGVRRGETEYAIGLTPFGGYVRMLGEEVGEEPRSDELQNYVREVALDVLETAEENRWNLPSKDPDEKILALAKRLEPSDTRVPEVIGRGLKAEEADVMNEIGVRGSVAEAQTRLAEHPTPALLQSFQKRSFPTQKLWKRFAIVLAGPVSNILFAPILMTFVFLWGVPIVMPIVGQAKEGLPAHAAGLLSGDRILAINGKPVDTWNDFSTEVKSGNGSPITLKISRGEGSSATQSTLIITPKREDEMTAYGNKAPTWIIGVMPRGDEEYRTYGPVDAVERGVGQTVEMAGTLIIGIWQIVNGSTPVRQALGGPIMIAQMAGKEAHEGLSALLMFTVMLSLELGIINLLPVPLLDGGHLLFFAFEGLRGKPLQLRTREMALQVGLLLLVALMAFVIFNDISHIVQG